MNKTTTRLLIWSLFLLHNFSLQAQHLDWVDKRATPIRQDLRLVTSVPRVLCNGTYTITEPPQMGYAGNYGYFYEANGQDNCYCGLNELPYSFSVPHTGQIIIVKRKFEINSNWQPYQESWSFYYPLQATMPTPTVTPVSSCNANDGSVTVVENSGNFDAMPRTFKLYDLQGNQIASSQDSVTQKTFTFSNLAPGSYKVKVFIKGCNNFAEQTLTIVGPTFGSIAGSTSICFGTGTQLTASGGSTYLWDNGSTSSNRLVTPTSAGTHTYTVTITANGCSVVRQHTLTVKPSPNSAVGGPDKACDNNSATLYANETGAYLWSNGATTSNLNLTFLQSTQTYSLTITGTNGCQSSSSKTVSVLERPTILGPSNICAGASANLNVQGGTTYQWSTGETTASISPFPTGTSTYNLTVTDANQCTYVLPKPVMVENIPDARITGASSVCAGESVNLTAFGGSTYLWSTGASTPTISVSPLNTTTYTVTVSSSGGCTATSNHTVLVKALPNGALSGPSTTCNSQAVNLTASGGASYLWNTGATTATISANPANPTTYTVTISSSEGCSITKNHVLTPGLTGTASNDGPLTCTKTTVTLQSNTPATGASYQWKNPTGSVISSNASTTVTTAGVYTLIMTEGACSYTTTTEVLLDRVPPNATANNNGSITCSLPNVTLSGSSTTAGVSYQWKNSGGTVIANTATTTVNQTGVYTLRVSASNGCTTEQSTTVSSNLSTPNLSGVGNDGPLTCTKTSVTLSASSSTSGVQYTWKTSGGTVIANTATASVSSTGTYTIEVQAPNGCKTTGTSTVTQTGTTPNISVNEPSAISCIEPQVWVSGSSSTSGVTYQWTNQNNRVVATQSGFNATLPGTYTLKVTAPNGCSNSASTTVADEMFLNFDVKLDGVNLGSTASYYTRTLTCTKTSVSLGVVPPGSGGSYFFYLINPQGGESSFTSSQTKTLNQVGTYFVKMAYSNGDCIRLKEIKITQDITTPTITVSGNQNICHNTSTSLSASGGSTYAWSTGATTSTLNVGPLTATTSYTLTVTGSNGCTANQPVVVTVNARPTANAGSAQSICLGSSATLSGSASGGTTPYTYLWSSGATTSTTSVSPNATTTYTLTVTDQKGCTGTSQVIITVNPLPTVNLGADRAICAGTSTTLSATGSGGATPYTYAWSTGASTSSITPSPGTTTTYTVTLSDNKNCQVTDEILITVNPALQATTGAGKQICSGESVQIEVGTTGGTGPFTYSWNTGATTANITVSPSTSSTYTVTATDNKGCQATAQGQVVVYNKPSLTNAADKTICAGNIANLVAGASGGTTPYTYLWNTGATTAAINVNPGNTTTYTVTVSDSHNCSAQANHKVIVNASPSPQLSVTNSIICLGESATLSAEGGSQFAWSTGASTSSITVSPVATTTYTVTVSNALNCSAVTQATITVKPRPSINAGSDLVLCLGSTATLQGIASGGTAPYTYAWSTGASTSSITPSPTVSTTYTVTVTDNLGCQNSDQVQVTVNPRPSINAGSDLAVCLGSTATLQGIASGSTAPYTYAWSTNASTSSIEISPTVSTTYTVTVTDNLGCQNTDQVQVTVNPRPSINAGSDLAVCLGSPATLQGIASGGTAPYTYAWSTGASTSSITPSPTVSTTYTVTVTDNLGCTNTDQVQVTVNPRPSINAGSDVAVCLGSPATLQGIASGETAPYTYAWSTGSSTSSITPSPTVSTTYTVTVTDNLGCQNTDQVQVTVNPRPSINAGSDLVLCLGSTATVDAVVSGGTSPYTYAWNTNASTGSIEISPTVSTTYTVTVTDNLGCQNTDQVQVTVNPLPIAQINGGAAIPFLCGSGSVTLTATTAAGNTYLWNTGETTATISKSTTTSISVGVTIKNIHECEANASALVTVIPRPQAQISGGEVPCRGNSTTLTASGGSTYLWSNNATTSSISITQPTQNQTYSVTVSNGPNCSSVAYKTVVVPDSFKLGYTLALDQDCILNNSTVIPVPSHAQGAVTYVITPLNTVDFSSTLQGWGSGQYTLTGVDAKGCIASTTVTIGEPAPLEVEVEITDSLSCFGGANAALAATATGGTAPYTYEWSTGDTTTIIEGLSSGTYTVTVVDSRGCEAIAQVNIVNPPKLMLAYTLSGDTLDCVKGNVQVALSTTGAQGGVVYHFDYPQSNSITLPNFSSGKLQRWVYALDTAGCIGIVKLIVKDSLRKLIQNYTTALDRDCIAGNASFTINLRPGVASLPLNFQLYRDSIVQSAQFTNLPSGFYLPRVWYQDCRDSMEVLIDERIPHITGFQYLHHDDCKPNNTGIKIQATSGWGTLRYQLDEETPQDSAVFDSLAAGRYRFTVTDSLQCQDSLYITISTEQPGYISVEDVSKCDSASGRITFRPNTQGVPAQYSIDGGKHWQTQVEFDSLPPGTYLPLRRKLSTGCVDSLQTVILGRNCDTIPEAYFLQDTIRITSPNELVLIRWEAKAPKWYRDTFYVKMKMDGDGFPHFNDGSRATAHAPELRGGDPLSGPNVYRYIGGGTHRDSIYVPLQDSAHLYTYPADYYFTLSTPPGGKTEVDPDRDITRVTVTLLGPEGTPEEEEEIILCNGCKNIGLDEVKNPDANCYYWSNFPNPGKQIQEVCNSGQYTRLALDENLKVMKKTVYTVKFSDLKVEIKEDFATPRACNLNENSLDASASSNSDKPFTFKWSTGETTQKVTLRSNVSTYKVTVTQAECTAEATYTLKPENNACEIKQFFESNGFFAIPISNLNKQPALRQPQLRDACAELSGSVKDYANYTFSVNGGQVNPQAQLTAALNSFSTKFGYTDGSGIITSNDEICDCSSYLELQQQRFNASTGLTYWYHVFENDNTCPELSCDVLFIKAKMPNGTTYPAGEQDLAFLAAGYEIATSDRGVNGSNLLTVLDDLCLDNFVAAKDLNMFELEPEEEDPEDVQELQKPCNQLGYHAESVAVVAPTGQVMMAPKSSVWRFRRPNKEQFVDGALTGFTQVNITEGEESIAIRTESGFIPFTCIPKFLVYIKLVKVRVGRQWKWGKRYEGRTYANQPKQFEGYFEVLGIDEEAFTFEVPPAPSIVQQLKVHTGKLDQAASSSQCGLKYVIYSNYLVYDPPKGFSTHPKGLLIKSVLEAGLGISTPEYSYKICREDLVKLASSLSTKDDFRSIEVYFWRPSNGLNPGLYYQIENNVIENGVTVKKKTYVFVADDPGVGRRYYQFNCALGIWEEIVQPELGRVLPKLAHLDALWLVFQRRREIHSALELAGFVPVVGNLAGITNGVLYITEGQTGQGTFEIVIGLIGLGLDIAEAGSIMRAAEAGGRGAVVQSIWQVTCPTAPHFRSEVELRSVLACNVEPVLGQVAAKAFNESIGKAASTIGSNALSKIEGHFNAFLKGNKGTAFLKWLHANQSLIPNVTKIIANAFGKFDFAVDDFAKLADDLTKNSSIIAKFANDIDLVQAWKIAAENGSTFFRIDIDFLTTIKEFLDNTIKPQYKSYGCSIYEEALMRHYSGPFHTSLNRALAGLETMTIKLAEFRDALNRALSKLSDYVGVVYRGLNREESVIADSWVKGQVITEPKFFSTSTKRDIAEDFRRGNVFLIIQSKTGKSIKLVTNLPEEEVLFKTGKKFIVDDINYRRRASMFEPLIKEIKLIEQ